MKLTSKVTAGIQHVQAAQFIEVSNPSTRGMVALKDINKDGTLTLNVVHVLGAGHLGNILFKAMRNFLPELP